MTSSTDAAPLLPAVVLAAGEGRRFAAAGGAGPKVLALLDGRPLLAHVVDAAETAGLAPIIVVVGPDVAADPRLDAALADRPAARVIVNVRADVGMGASLATGLAHLDEDGSHDACVVLLGDQPGIDAHVIARVVATWRTTARPTRARYDDGPSHPVLLPAGMWPSFADATSKGARDALSELDVAEVTVAGRSPRDVDRPIDLDALGGPDSR